MSLGKNINGAIDSQQKVQQILGDDQVEFGITGTITSPTPLLLLNFGCFRSPYRSAFKIT